MANAETVGRPVSPDPLNVDEAVRSRYSGAAQAPEAALCCPVNYDAQYLSIVPQEIIERDYGCGDPSKYLERGDTVLDLGSGGGKICFIAAQIVGAEGRVIGVDCNDEMLALARKYRQQVGEAIGFDNVTFHKGRIQDLALDLDVFEAFLREQPVGTSGAWLEAQERAQQLRRTSPMIPDNSVDVVVSNCVLNLVDKADRRQLFAEIYRVLKRGGRAVISDITADEPVPDTMERDPKLWSGCISGAFVEDEFCRAFEDAGFYGVEIVERQADPWTVVSGYEFRSLTLRAYKGKDGPCLDRKQAVIYQGPWRSVTDDDGHVLRRGERMAVCDKTFQIYTRPPYADQILAIEPYQDVPLDEAPQFDCRRNAVREARETKGQAYTATKLPQADCCSGDDCC